MAAAAIRPSSPNEVGSNELHRPFSRFWVSFPHLNMRLFRISIRRAATLTAFLILAAVSSLSTPSSLISAETGCGLVIIFPGGPKPGSSGQRVIDEFVAKLNQSMTAPLQGSYFNEAESALAHLKEHPDSFVLGSTGFFLTHRENLKLVPMARLVLPENQPEQYFLVTKKGAFTELASLKSAKIAGTPFYESERFLDRIVFKDAIAVGSFFQKEATGRPLSSLRQLTAGEIDGVLLNAPQYQSLANLPLAQELDVTFTSEPIASIGLMRLDSAATEASADDVKTTLLDLSKTPEGIEVCKGFGVAGFEAIETEKVEELVTAYEKP